ncbi:LEPR-XLL domain-containing protein [Fibrobacter sp. UBA2449]|uniref:LEPR-XLL domain-containing protein n=1 Tax=Fibrobacter sp. UBA2449 TaxID=1946529 RepID=UPI0025BF55CF|nr:LEPR-XLL domain-containing protein [Fibrobacter sp. UBA2449]
MSKKVNKKKNTRNNYKIESLEPRLMMDADVNLEEFGNQIESISTVVDNSISSISDLDLSSLGLDSKLDSASELISNAGDTIKTKIEGIYSSYLSSFESAVESVKIEDLVSALNNNIGDLPSGVSELSFVQEGHPFP